MFGAKLVHFLFMVLLFMQCTTFKVLTNVIIIIYILLLLLQLLLLLLLLLLSSYCFMLVVEACYKGPSLTHHLLTGFHPSSKLRARQAFNAALSDALHMKREPPSKMCLDTQ